MRTKHAVRGSLFFIFLITGGFSFALANVYTVTTTSDAGPGSLRQAMTDANTHIGADTITFNIPTTDAGYNAVMGVWTIRPTYALPSVTDNGTMIDGTTQATHQGDKNSVGPEIELRGELAGTTTGIDVSSAKNVIRGLIINRFKFMGITIHGTSSSENLILGNYIGTDPTGMVRQGNDRGAITIVDGTHNNQIGNGTAAGRNLLAGSDSTFNILTGNGIYIDYSDSNRVVGNYIGVNREGTLPLHNVDNGIVIRRSRYNVIGGTTAGEANIISANRNNGVLIRSYADARNVIRGNYIGTDVTGRVKLGNLSYGIRIDFGASKNTVGPGNVIAYNGIHGVYLTHDTTIDNTITRNAIYSHEGQGIMNSSGGNKQLMRPTITSISPTAVSGTAVPNSTVEIFSDSADEGAVYRGTTTANAAGLFTWNGAAGGPRVTATCTDATGSTSEFSSPMVSVGETNPLAEVPAQFALSQNYPNPFNPTTVVSCQLPVATRVRLVVYDLLGQEVATLIDENKPAGVHEVQFDATALASGVYVYRLTAGSFLEAKKLTVLR